MAFHRADIISRDIGEAVLEGDAGLPPDQLLDARSRSRLRELPGDQVGRGLRRGGSHGAVAVSLNGGNR